MQKYRLNVNRLKRVKYDHFNVGTMKPGEIRSININDSVKTKLFYYMKNKINHYTKKERDTYL